MSTLDEKRRFAAGADTRTLLVATGVGLARVEVAGDRVGEVGIARRCAARDLATDGEYVALATAEGVHVATTTEGGATDGRATDDIADTDLEPIEAALDTSFGPPTAVGVQNGAVLAADERGTVVRGTVVRGTVEHGTVGASAVERDDAGSTSEVEWRRLGELPDIAAIDGNLVASPDGVHRVVDGDLQHAGLEAVTDVASAVPHAATETGLYRLANGWVDVLDADVRVVAIDAESASAGGFGRAHAASAESCYAHEDGEWTAIDVPVEEPIADVAYAAGVYAITATGTLLADDGDGWRRHVLGLADARALAMAPEVKRARTR